MRNRLESLMTSSVAFVGIGQGGGNLADCFRELGYTTFYINTSPIDLQTIDVNKNFKYQIPLGKGCAKDRKLAKMHCKDYFGKMETLIVNRLGNFSHIFLCFSGGGGTGSGITPLLMKNLAKKHPDIKFGAICALPHYKESAQTHRNAVECYRELEMAGNALMSEKVQQEEETGRVSNLPTFGNIYFIDNNACFMDKKQVLTFDQLNAQFAEKLNMMLSMIHADKNGNADEQEVQVLLSIYGNTTIADIIPSNEFNDRVVVDRTLAKPSKGCSRLAYSVQSDDYMLEEEVEDMFGKPSDFFKGYTTMDSFVVAFGLPFPITALNSLATTYNENIQMVGDVDEEVVHNVKLSKFVDPSHLRHKSIKLADDIDAILDELEDF